MSYFQNALNPYEAKKIFYQLVKTVKSKNIPTEIGIFGSHMKLRIVNDGPVTIIIDTKDKQ